MLSQKKCTLNVVTKGFKRDEGSFPSRELSAKCHAWLFRCGFEPSSQQTVFIACISWVVCSVCLDLKPFIVLTVGLEEWFFVVCKLSRQVGRLINVSFLDVFLIRTSYLLILYSLWQVVHVGQRWSGVDLFFFVQQCLFFFMYLVDCQRLADMSIVPRSRPSALSLSSLFL